MCGICGIVYSERHRRVEAETVQRMCAAIVHRGPDDAGYHLDGAVGLGIRRLAIIDLPGGHQPIANEDDSLHVVFNGEIYNYRELRGALESRGHAFRTRSDTEVIVHAYEEHGVECLHRLRGMFALALWDSRDRSLFLAGDRFGIKPLYYSATPERIVFGSELGCLLRADLGTPEVDLDALAEYFTFNYIPPPGTIFTGIRKLAPGSFLRWTPGCDPVQRQYWELPQAATTDDSRDPRERRQLLRSALADAVRSHLVSDVPVGAFLSGGIDSSVVVALMSEASGERVRTFSIGFSDPRYSELDKARIVARHFHTDHHELIVEPDAVDQLPRLVAQYGEPFADPSALPTYYVSKLAREHVKVALSGDGGDELFLGYPVLHGLELSRRAQALPSVVRAAIAAAPRLLHSRKAERNDRLQLLAKRSAETMLPPDAAYRRKMTATGLAAIGPFLTPELRGELSRRSPFATMDAWVARYSLKATAHPLERFIRTALQFSLPGDMLVKVDRASMANSLEVRVPLLDHVLAEHVAGIPVAQRIPRWRLKGLLKETMSDTLPAEILNQPKRGFNVPLAAWFRGDLQDFALDVLTSPDARRRGFFDVTAVEKLLGEHSHGTTNLGSVIWSLVVFELWCLGALTR
jgi:asparagine synthase (glutamine-hydrolysing)